MAMSAAMLKANANWHFTEKDLANMMGVSVRSIARASSVRAASAVLAELVQRGVLPVSVAEKATKLDAPWIREIEEVAKREPRGVAAKIAELCEVQSKLPLKLNSELVEKRTSPEEISTSFLNTRLTSKRTTRRF
jgi:hypothetical protein